MKLTKSNLLVAVAATFVGITAGLGVAGTQSSPQQVAEAPASAETFVYFPSQYELNATAQAGEHIQAF